MKTTYLAACALCLSLLPGAASAADGGPLHVNGEVQSAKLVEQIKPTYPVLAKTARVEGTVTLQVSIAKDGAVSKTEVVSGPALLTRGAQEAVRQWKYKPTIVDGQQVEVVTTVKVIFSMK